MEGRPSGTSPQCTSGRRRLSASRASAAVTSGGSLRLLRPPCRRRVRPRRRSRPTWPCSLAWIATKPSTGASPPKPAGASGLQVQALPKAYGPPFLMLGLNLENTTSDSFRIALTARYLGYDVVGSGSELRVDGTFGSDPSIAAELYRPFGASPVFVAPVRGGRQSHVRRDRRRRGGCQVWANIEPRGREPRRESRARERPPRGRLHRPARCRRQGRGSGTPRTQGQRDSDRGCLALRRPGQPGRPDRRQLRARQAELRLRWPGHHASVAHPTARASSRRSSPAR